MVYFKTRKTRKEKCMQFHFGDIWQRAHDMSLFTISCIYSPGTIYIFYRSRLAYNISKTPQLYVYSAVAMMAGFKLLFHLSQLEMQKDILTGVYTETVLRLCFFFLLKFGFYFSFIWNYDLLPCSLVKYVLRFHASKPFVGIMKFFFNDSQFRHVVLSLSPRLRNL